MIIQERAARFAPWLTKPMMRHRRTYLNVGVAAAMINLLGLVISLFTMTVYDRVIPHNATASLIVLTIGLVVVVIFDFILRILRAYFVDIAGADIDHEVGQNVFARILALRLEHRRGSTGALTGLMRELETLREFFASATLTALVDVPFIILTLILIGIVGGWIVLVPISVIPIVVAAGWLSHPAMDRLSAKTLNEGLIKQSVLVETIGGIEAVKTSGAGQMMMRRWMAAMHQQSDSALRQRLISNISVTVASSANTIAYAGTVVVGVGLVATQNLTTGGLVACSILVGRAIAPLAQIAQLLSRLNSTRTAYRELNTLMNTPIEGPENDALLPGSLSGAIEFRGVSFKYPGAAERTLDNLSFAVRAGEHVALLGRVGSGKSTIAKLIMGLYPPDEGVLLLDSTDIRQFDPQALRTKIGTVMQESVLFSGSVRDNIMLGDAGQGDEELLRVAEISGTHSFIGRMTNGYDLRLTDRGEGLSGGQRQSIAIARALAGQKAILLLDEPTSSMDSQTEAQLLQRMRLESEGRTLILVTHRPPLLALVDRIILLDRGKIVADGPRDAILAKMASQGAS